MRMVVYSSFRPLIGVILCKHYWKTCINRRCDCVSVPLSGLSYVNIYGVFPAATSACFRPLIGVILCKRSKSYFCYRIYGRVSVPLSGLSYVNYYNSLYMESDNNSFRPLIGVILCKPYPLSALITQGFQVALACLKFNKLFFFKF